MDKMKPDEFDTEGISAYLVQLQTLQKTDGYHLFMQQVNLLTKMAFSKLLASEDPTVMAKETGRIAALREISAWVDTEIQATLERQGEFNKSKKR